MQCEWPFETSKAQTLGNRGPFFPHFSLLGSQESVLKVPQRGQFHAAIRMTTKRCDSCAQGALVRKLEKAVAVSGVFAGVLEECSGENCWKKFPEAPNATNSGISGTGKGKPAGNLGSTLLCPSPHLPCGVFFEIDNSSLLEFFLTRETDGIAAKLLRCRIASEALRRNLPFFWVRLGAV